MGRIAAMPGHAGPADLLPQASRAA
jgi:hypothetical protein